LKFHGPEEKLNNIIHEAYKDHRRHQMFPQNLPTKLEKIGFKNYTNNGNGIFNNSAK